MARLDRKPAEHVAVAGMVIQIIGGILCFVVSQLSRSASAWVLTWQLLIGVLVWVIALMRLRHARLAEEEQTDWERLQAERAAGGARGRLFEEDEIQAFSSRDRLRVLNKWITPTFSVLVALGLILVVALTLRANLVERWEMIIGAEATQGASHVIMILMALFVAVTFVLFLISRYAAGMAEQVEWRPLRAPAAFMMCGTLFAAATVASFAVAKFGFGRPDDVLAYVMLALMGVIAIEILLNFVLDFYRPRQEGVEDRPAFDSRLLGMLVTPTSLLKTVSATLDYQFGFRVSQTWLYRFTEQWIAPLILFDIATLYVLTCFVVVGSEQQGLLERRGVFQAVLKPGLHFKLPWPLERVYRFPANEVKTIYLGHTGELEESNTLVWTSKHFKKEYNVLVATRNASIGAKDVPVNLLVATTTVRYKIRDVKKWYYSSAEPLLMEQENSENQEGAAKQEKEGAEELLAALCEREQIKYLAGVDMFEVMSVGRQKASEDLRKAMQDAADHLVTQEGQGLGVEILSVGVQGMHPPVEPGVPEAFHDVVDALTQKATDILQAEESAIQTVATATSEAQVTKLNAQSYYADRVSAAEGEAKRFVIQSRVYGGSPEVFKAREYFSALEKGFQDARKYVVAVKGLDRKDFRLNLEDPVSLEMESLKYEKPQK